MKGRKEQNTQDIFAFYAGAATGGLAEMLLFYPPEKIARCLQINKEPLKKEISHASCQQIKKIILGENVSGIRATIKTFYAGFSAGLIYKIFQRTYKFGSQQPVNALLDNYMGNHYRQLFGDQYAAILLAGSSGMLIGAMEAPLLLPLDAIKVRFQTNNNDVKDKSILEIFKQEGTKLYRGMSWTIGRNIIGSMSLFSVQAYLKTVIPPHHIDANGKAHFSLPQTAAIAIVAATCSIITSNPPDVIKTRIQSGKELETAGMNILANLWKNEGGLALFKGAVTKSITTGPKVAFAMVAAEEIAKTIQHKLSK